MADNKSIFNNLMERARYAVTGKHSESFFGPGEPLQTQAPEELKGRVKTYSLSVNKLPNNKDIGTPDYKKLRNLATNCSVLQTVINKKKDSLSRFKFKIQRRDFQTSKIIDPNAKIVEDFMRYPDGQTPFDAWVRAIYDDVMVTDTACVYPQKTNGGKLLELKVMDGTTIKKILDQFGQTPRPPNVAYQQWLYGMPAWDYTTDELIYMPRNKLSWKDYGYSPVEQIFNTIENSIAKQKHAYVKLTQGNTPDLIAGVPEDWSGQQIEDFQLYWEELTSDPFINNKVKFVPGGINFYDTKNAALKDDFDDFITRIICAAFSVSPQPYIKEMNRATAETASASSQEEGLYPMMEWFKDLMNLIIEKHFGFTELEFLWDVEPETDPKIKAEIHKIYLEMKVLTPNEVREEIGREELSEEQLEEFKALMPKPIKTFEEEEDGEPLQRVFKKKSSEDNTKESIFLTAIVVAAVYSIENIIERYFKKQVSYIKQRLNIKRSVDVDISVSDTETFATIKAVKKELDIIGKVASSNSLKFLQETDPKIFKQVSSYVEHYTLNRSAELIGKKILKNGSIIDNKNAKYAITDTTRDSVKSLVNEAIEGGWSNDELAKKLEDSYSFSKVRANVIARTETNIADNDITMNSFKASGVEKKRWLTANDGKVEKECLDNQAQGAIGIDELFLSGEICPPCHPNCRCTVLADFS